MKKLGYLVVFLISFFAFGANAQELKEVNGVYYADTVAYTGKHTVRYPNGNIKIEMNLLKGMKNGTVNVYFENCQNNEVRSYKNNLMHGSWITYNEQKVLIGLANYKDGLKHGTWMIWDASGNLLYELHYDMGEKVGIWRNFCKNGEIISEREYPEKPVKK
jgi:antitoxin component YwqK of YwqJK toxin-antitoxin module